ncbi:MAG: DUF2066 domain-containing protein [Alphaproteobacteria bacterium]
MPFLTTPGPAPRPLGGPGGSMFRMALLTVLVAGLWLGAVHPAAANIYVVEGVDVDATADNAANARKVAHSQGWRKAFEVLLRRMTRPEDWPFLPSLSDARVTDLGAGLRIEDERNSQNRYLARITYTFKPQAVREALVTVGIPFSETPSAPLLVLPILERNGRLHLWEQPNPWLDVWTNRPDTNDLVPIVAPLGDLTDIAALSPEEAIEADWLRLQPLAERYGAGAVLLVVAVETPVGSSVPGDPFARGQAGASEPLSASAEGIEPGAGTQTEGEPRSAAMPVTGSIDEDTVRLQLGIVRVDRNTRIPFESVAQGSSAARVSDAASVYRRAMDEVMGLVSRDWKSRTLVDFASRFQMDATVRLASIRDWTDIQARLEKIPTVVAFETDALSFRGAEIRVTFVGTVDQLALSLDQGGLMLSGEKGYWEITRRGIVPTALEDANGNRPRVFPLSGGSIGARSAGSADPRTGGGGYPGPGSFRGSGLP